MKLLFELKTSKKAAVFSKKRNCFGLEELKILKKILRIRQHIF